jgi:hypothetical protein
VLLARNNEFPLHHLSPLATTSHNISWSETKHTGYDAIGSVNIINTIAQHHQFVRNARGFDPGVDSGG